MLRASPSDRSPRHAGFIGRARFAVNARRLVDQYDVRLQASTSTVRYLSGGNQQKIILARELEARPDVLVVAQPTKGLDMGAIEFVQNALLRDAVAVPRYSTSRPTGASSRGERPRRRHLPGADHGDAPRSRRPAERLGLLMSGAREAMGP